MQRDTTPASSKVGAPVFKLIVVFVETTTLPLHKTKNKPPPKTATLKEVAVFICMEMKPKGKWGSGCFWTWDSGDALCPLWEKAGKSHVIPSGSGRWHYEFHLVPCMPLPRPCLSSSLICWQHGPAGNQRQMWTHAVHRSSSRYRKDDLAFERQ